MTTTTNSTNTNVTIKKVKTVKIKLPRIKAEDSDVFVSVNDYSCLIKRGVEVEVPDFVAEVLHNQELAEMKAEEFNDSAESK